MSQLVVRHSSCTTRSAHGHGVKENKIDSKVENGLKHTAHFRRKNYPFRLGGVRNFWS